MPQRAFTGICGLQTEAARRIKFSFREPEIKGGIEQNGKELLLYQVLAVDWPIRCSL